MFPVDHWYAIAEASELRGHRPLALRRLGLDLALWRGRDGALRCVLDRCPHRGASLAAGRVIGDEIECPFHGFRFDAGGTCTHAPCEGDTAPAHVRTDAFEIRERNGLLWLWWPDPARETDEAHATDPESIRPIPWFDELGQGHYSSAFGGRGQSWPTNYMRAVENQLDWAHLPFVHRNSIGAGFPHRIEVNSSLEGDYIFTWPTHMEDASGKPSFYLRFAFPNLWMNPIGSRMFAMLAFAPIDAHNTQIYVRTYQRISGLPILRNLIGAVMNTANRFVLSQDRRVVLTQPPESTASTRDEKLVQADIPIGQFRREVRRRARRASETGADASRAPSSPSSGDDAEDDGHHDGHHDAA